MTDLPEADRLEGAPHPRHTPVLFGQDSAAQDFVAAVQSGRLHHAWLLTGPRGVGKATLAWRMARMLLAGADSLDIPPDHPVARRIAALSEPGVFLLRRGLNSTGKGLSAVIRIDEARPLRQFFALSQTGGGRRVVIIDAADDLNPQAANAVLKLLEEPPPGAVLLLIAHQPARLLPTIRSRCRTLACAPLPPDLMARALEQAGAAPPADPAALAALAGGSVGTAFELIGVGGLDLYAGLVRLMGQAPGLDRAAALAWAETGAAQFDQAVTLSELLLMRLARAAVLGPPEPPAAPDEPALIARLAPDLRAARKWADLAQAMGVRARAGRAVNLDPQALLMDMVLQCDATARSL